MIEHRERPESRDHSGGPGNPEGRDVVAELRTAAASHEPDRIRMLARVTAGMTAGDRRRARRTSPLWARVVSPAAGLAAAVAATGIAVVATDGTERPQTVRTSSEPAAPPADAGAGTGADSATASADADRRRAGNEPGAGSQSDAERHTPSAYPTAAGPNHLAEPTVRSKGAINAHSNPYWAQSDITLTLGRPLTSLTVELRVADTGGVRSTGSWHSLPTGDVTTATRVEDGVLVYRWTLRKGATVPAGRYVFAGQYNHAEGDRDTGRDAYAASGNGASGAFAVRGDFPQFTAGD
ncbi:hypothetical protein [Streptomyces rugosispiralis]|uniref:Uncharacterized protein n=1 Tax=Streptomyces rugosispiralis TaxID=2967341 RepID=A0ABT1UWX5_9ACTN|nr:hypothetical protein [Streptomyces rugosispiralis]MCQ8189045.1 hypothetical protein [Streptomyces rugosispiralis]